MNCCNFYYNILIPALVALLVSLITIYLTDKRKRRTGSKSMFNKICADVQRIILRNNPDIYEEDFNYHIKELEYQVISSIYLDKELKSSLEDKLQNLKYQFTDLTRSDLDQYKREESKTNAISTIQTIRSIIEVNI